MDETKAGQEAGAATPSVCEICGRLVAECARAFLAASGFRHSGTADCYRLGYQRLRRAVLWALGNSGDFRTQATGEGRYYWRKELRVRAFPLAPPTPRSDK